MADSRILEYTGPYQFDISDAKDALVDIPGSDKQGYMREKPDIDRALAELVEAMPAHAEAIGIHPKFYEQVLTGTAKLKVIRKHLPGVAKAHEVLEESEIYHEDLREAGINHIAKLVEEAARSQPGLLAAFEQTRAYRSQYAEKAAATRRKNEAAAAQSQAAEGTTGESTPAEAKPGNG